MAFILLYFIGVIQTSTHDIDNLFQDRPRGPDHGSRRAQRSHGWWCTSTPPVNQQGRPQYSAGGGSEECPARNANHDHDWLSNYLITERECNFGFAAEVTLVISGCYWMLHTTPRASKELTILRASERQCIDQPSSFHLHSRGRFAFIV